MATTSSTTSSRTPSASGPSGFRRFFAAIGRVLDVTRSVVVNVLFLVVVILVLTLIFAGPDVVRVPDGGALVMAPRGAIVEQRTQISPVARLTGAGVAVETRLRDIVRALERAAEDDRIQSVVLNLSEITQIAPAHLETIGVALERLREQGRQVIAMGDFYTQPQYALATHADVVYLHPMGQILLPGYGGNITFFKGLIDRLKINVNIFRVGEYKSPVEPFTRSDLSPEARENNQALVDDLWRQYLDDVAPRRELSRHQLDDYAQRFAAHAETAGGDMARVALEHGLVDELLTHDEFRSHMIDQVGEAQGTFRQIGFRDYLRTADRQRAPARSENEIGVLVAQGMILPGEQPRGTIGAETVVALLREAREKEELKALVLRVDSPGGSAFASEVIRQELELAQITGTPVVVSMGGTAASGGYWIAATADEIWAAPSTVTGSIGIFGIVPTFEETLAEIGISRDGVGTTPLSRGADPLAGLSEEARSIIQANLEFGYRQFLNLVTRGRNLAPEQAEQLSRGQVWSGRQALELGLIDGLGGLDAAVEAAARLANIDEYELRYLEKPLTPGEQLMRQLIDGFALAPAADLGRFGQLGGPLDALARLIEHQDPLKPYALCELCASLP